MYVYFIEQDIKKGLVKIGKSSSPEARLRALQTGSDIPLKLMYCHKCSDDKAAYKLERQLHEHYSYIRQNGEWFKGRHQLRRLARALEEGDPKAIHRVLSGNKKQKAKKKASLVVSVGDESFSTEECYSLLCQMFSLDYSKYMGKKAHIARARELGLHGSNAEVFTGAVALALHKGYRPLASHMNI